MRKAKEVKVINRWRADDFDGEIPIEGDDEEMLGTAMKMANGVGQLQGVVQDSMPLVQPITWFGFYGGGGYVAGNGAAALFSKTADKPDRALTYYAGRVGYFAASGLLSVMTNGIPQGLGEISRAGGVFAGTAMLGYRQSSIESPRIDSLLLKGALASYGVAGVSYLGEKVKERFF
tara:strand:- start:12939 stop:13466 length:528 start_codon:yes stop_codon:yes gene_type:complete